jgi:2-polyprenyl-3-methyl-5-hydroxy-6-metoxy-1,4-benzoquinol methylase
MANDEKVMLPFDLPAAAGYSVPPRWDGRNFVCGSQSTPVLEYSENSAGWSDDLTALIDDDAGGSHPIDLASRNDALAQVKKFMPCDKAVIMEIGCSSGFLIRDLAKNFPGATIIGSDVVKEPLYRLARDFPGIPLIRFDVLRCPVPDQSIDVLIMLNVLEHIEDDAGALQKAFNLLKPGGVLIIEVPAGSCLFDAYDIELRHFRRYAAAELYGKLVRAGFMVCRKSHLGFVVFPAFALVKLFQKWRTAGKKKAVVRKQAGSTYNNALVKLALKFESSRLSDFQLPYGIRVLAVARREN